MGILRSDFEYSSARPSMSPRELKPCQRRKAFSVVMIDRFVDRLTARCDVPFISMDALH